jgi:hypothetical protein
VLLRCLAKLVHPQVRSLPGICARLRHHGGGGTTVAARQQAAAAGEFRSDALAVQRVVQVQLDTIGAVTHAAAALLGASPEINFSEFRAFVSGLELRERYPGLDGHRVRSAR